MAPTDNELKERIVAVLKERVDTDTGRRAEALHDFFAITMPAVEKNMCAKLAELVPTIMPGLYDKWFDQFADRLFETVPRAQIEELCDGTDKNSATLILVYLMFMESERMEKQVRDDLAAYAKEHSDDEDMGELVRNYVTLKMAQLKSGNQVQ